MRVAMTIFVAAAAWAGAAHAQTKPVPALAPVAVVRTELAPTNSNSNQTLTHVCTDGEDLSLSGSSNRVTLSGACHSLLISGSGNKIGSEKPLDVDATGNDNAVTWPKVSAEPHLNFVGTGNSAGPQKN